LQRLGLLFHSYFDDPGKALRLNAGRRDGHPHDPNA